MSRPVAQGEHPRDGGFPGEWAAERPSRGPDWSCRRARTARSSAVSGRLLGNWGGGVGGELRPAREVQAPERTLRRPYLEQPMLATWLAHQRERARARKLRPDRLARLDALGFLRNRREEVWEAGCRQLAAFQREHGHSAAPRFWKDEFGLGVWVARQRRYAVTGHLHPERKRRLNTLDFVWRPFETSWKACIAQLSEFKDRYGHGNVPALGALGKWIKNQRWALAQGKLSAKREAQLRSLGVDFGREKITRSRLLKEGRARRVPVLDKRWERRFAQLLRFHARSGHCEVPGPLNGFKLWVETQRTLGRQGALFPERARKLESLGMRFHYLWPRRG
ncbi:MAG: helicase associated domain-containing protein [Myxococcaceae bacterium]